MFGFLGGGVLKVHYAHKLHIQYSQNTWSISSWPDSQRAKQIKLGDAAMPAGGFRVWGELNPGSYLNC